MAGLVEVDVLVPVDLEAVSMEANTTEATYGDVPRPALESKVTPSHHQNMAMLQCMALCQSFGDPLPLPSIRNLPRSPVVL